MISASTVTDPVLSYFFNKGVLVYPDRFPKRSPRKPAGGKGKVWDEKSLEDASLDDSGICTPSSSADTPIYTPRSHASDIDNRWKPTSPLAVKVLRKHEARTVTLDDQLAKAVKSNDMPFVDALLEAGASPDLVEAGSKLPLVHWAISRGNLPLLRILLAHGACPNAPTMSLQQTALHRAVAMHNIPAMRMLMEAGCEVEPLDAGGRTPLALALARLSEQPAMIINARLGGKDSLTKSLEITRVAAI